MADLTDALFVILALIAPIPIAAVVAGFGLCDFLNESDY